MLWIRKIISGPEIHKISEEIGAIRISIAKAITKRFLLLGALAVPSITGCAHIDTSRHYDTSVPVTILSRQEFPEQRETLIPGTLLVTAQVRGDVLTFRVNQSSMCVIPANVQEKRTIITERKPTGFTPALSLPFGGGLISIGAYAGTTMAEKAPDECPEDQSSTESDKDKCTTKKEYQGIGMGLVVLGAASIIAGMVDAIKSADSREEEVTMRGEKSLPFPCSTSPLLVNSEVTIQTSKGGVAKIMTDSNGIAKVSLTGKEADKFWEADSLVFIGANRQVTIPSLAINGFSAMATKKRQELTARRLAEEAVAKEEAEREAHARQMEQARVRAKNDEEFAIDLAIALGIGGIVLKVFLDSFSGGGGSTITDEDRERNRQYQGCKNSKEACRAECEGMSDNMDDNGTFDSPQDRCQSRCNNMKCPY